MAEGPRERSPISVRGVLIGAGAIFASVLVSVLAAGVLLKSSGGEPPAIVGKPFSRVAGPALEATPQEDLRGFRAEERRKLEEYRLVDEKAGVVHIPIERAMAQLAEEHGAASGEDARQ